MALIAKAEIDAEEYLPLDFENMGLSVIGVPLEAQGAADIY